MSCPICHGSGETGHFGIFDCAAPGCTAAQERYAIDMAIMKMVADEGRLHPHDERWEAYKLGKAAALADLQSQIKK